jgi:putative membrane-bound dehydrogenase-like protein
MPGGVTVRTAPLATPVRPRYPALMRAISRLLLPLLVLLPFAFGQTPKAEPDSQRIPPKTPAESLKAFEVAPGFRVELVAAEPLVQSPMACDWDEDGRLYVVELPEYNAYAATRPHGRGRVVVLEDTDGDGVMDKRTVLADNLDYPTGILCYNGGVYVGAAPELLYIKDTNGDGKADTRQVVLTGFAKDKAGEGQLNSFRWTLENRILISTGLDGGELQAPDGKAVSLKNQNVLLNPRGGWETTSGGGQHGMTVDDFGRVFVSGNSEPIQYLAYDARCLKEAPLVQAPQAAVNILPSGKFTKLHRISEVEPWRELRTKLRKEGKVAGSDEGGSPSGFFTGATGGTVYRGDAFPAEYRGDIFVGEVANNLVFRAKLKPNGSVPVAERADPEREFLASRDVWFRPVQFANGPDGCLYVIDMYRELIEGAAFLPPQALKTVDPSAGIDKGRIWRIVPEGFKRREPPKLSREPVAELVKLLDHPNGWHRDTASRLLFERKDKAATEPLKALARNAKTPQGRVHALYALKSLTGNVDDALCKAALADADPRVREQALRLSERPPSDKPRTLTADDVWKLRFDPDPNVRIQFAHSLRNIHVQTTDEGKTNYAAALIFVHLALKDGADPWMRLAILSGMESHHMDTVFYQLATSQYFRGMADGPAFILALCELAAGEPDGEHGTILAETVSALALGTRTVRADAALARSMLRTVRTRGSVRTLAMFDDQNEAQNIKAIADFLAKDAAVSARDARKPVAVRVAAIRDLQILPFKDAAGVLAETIKATQPPEIQIATLEVLGRFGDERTPAIILEAWPAMTPKVRATATEVWLSRNNWVPVFLDAVESRKVARADIDPARVALLKKHPARNIGSRAAKLFAAPADRQKVFEEYRKALELKGDPEKGKLVFKNQCSACHRLEGVGEEVGADLKAIRDRGLEAVLLNIIDPNREVKPQFLAYSAELKNMRVVTGMLAAETATGLTIRRPDGQSESIQRADVENLRSLGVSYMPEGLEKQIDVPAMADLLAYLNSIK